MGNPMEDLQLPRLSSSKVFLQPKKIEKQKNEKISMSVSFLLLYHKRLIHDTGSSWKR